MNGAQFVCEALLQSGINICFANPGTSEMHFVAALDSKPQMRCVLGLFEGVVTGAADGYARMAGKPAATLLHLGSGLSNASANLHNAKRAHTPMVNIVGDHARHHLAYDAPLTSDIRSLATAVSNSVVTIAAPETVAQDMHRGISAALHPEKGISTIILPADVAWSDVPEGCEPLPLSDASCHAVSDDALVRAADALQRPNAVLLLGGRALTGAALSIANTIAHHTGATLLAETSNSRMRRGRGTARIDKLPYPVDAAIERLRPVRELVLAGSRSPVAFFAYPGKPSDLLPENCKRTVLATPFEDVEDALKRLMAHLGIQRVLEPAVEAQPLLPPANDQPLDADSVCRAIAALLPDDAIVTDEGLTQGRSFFSHSFGAAPHDYLQLTGGAIGIGLPLAIGAAVACPERQVVSLQADGSGMYTLQALWTQARERLKCLTVIFSNRRYAILHQEMANVGVTEMGKNAHNMLSLADPDLQWTKLAEGMGVAAVRATTIAEFIAAFEKGLAHDGPFLIEAAI